MKEIAELERRIAELERRLDEYVNRDEINFTDEFITTVERGTFKMLVAALDELTPGIADVLRRNMLQIEDGVAADMAARFPQMSQINGWMKVRGREVIDAMLPSPEER